MRMKKIGIFALSVVLGLVLLSVSLRALAATIPGDFNGDGKVNLQDLQKFATWYKMNSSDPNWNVASPPWAAPSAADFNGDGVIDLADLVTLAMYYSTSPL
jgi:hypothetical protein